MKPSVKKLADLIALLILWFSAGNLLWARLSGDCLLMYKHMAGLALLLITSLAFLKNHKIGVLLLGLTILLGLAGLLSYSPTVAMVKMGAGIRDAEVWTPSFQPVFLLWLVIHFIFSLRYYTGILTARYWKNIGSEEPLVIE